VQHCDSDHARRPIGALGSVHRGWTGKIGPHHNFSDTKCGFSV
jgi:hypothetical protein